MGSTSRSWTEEEADAKAFAAAPGRLAVYLVRKRCLDTKNVVQAGPAGGIAAGTVPRTFVRWRLPPGSHRMIARWAEGTTTLDITGTAGDILFVELVGSAWSSGSNYRLELGHSLRSRDRATSLRLVADFG